MRGVCWVWLTHVIGMGVRCLCAVPNPGVSTSQLRRHGDDPEPLPWVGVCEMARNGGVADRVGEVRERDRGVVGQLLLEPAVVDRFAVQPWRRPGLEPAAATERRPSMVR